MNRIRASFVFVILMGGIAKAAGFGSEMAPEPMLLRDGFALAGVDGKLIGSDSNDVWFFELGQDVNDYRAVAKAGTRLELLPSSTLEKMVADARKRSTSSYRLWNAEVTKYKGKNFIFPRYFLPLREPEDASQKGKEEKRETEGRPQTKDLGPPSSEPNTLEIAIDEPNDVLTVPPEIIERFKERRKRPTTISLRQIMDSNEVPAGEVLSETPLYRRGTDSVFVDRTGFLVQQDDGGFVFTPDGLGRNVQRLSPRLLPGEILELTERLRSAEIERLRFKVAGVLTTYKDEKYLLLQKATRTYSYGNFSR